MNKKILIVSSYNKGYISSFIEEQVNSIKDKVIVEYFNIIGSGISGYLKNYPSLKRNLKCNEYDIIHAHYGLSGMLAKLQRKIPVVTTYHGSDVHYYKNRLISKLCSKLSSYNILTNNKQVNQLGLRANYDVIPCGIDIDIFKPIDKNKCKKYFNLSENKKYILFSSSFDRKVKNPKLAIEAVEGLDNVELIELKGYTRDEVSKIINACELVLITSNYETGPLIAKEAMACNTPVVSLDVGDVKYVLDDLSKYYIVDRNIDSIREKIINIMNDKKNIELRKKVVHYNIKETARKIIEIYNQI